MKRWLIPILIVALCIPLALFLFSGFLGGKVDQEALRLAEQTVRRAAVQCYALEGAYPDKLSYLKDHYGVAVDENSFLVDYRYIGSNLMPDITILPIS